MENTRVAYKAVIGIVALLMFLIAGKSEAARMFFTPLTNTSTVQEPSTLVLMLDPEGSEVNALEATIYFRNDTFEVESVSEKNSIISHWIERPEEPSTCREVCEIKFSGVIPGGIKGILSPYYEGYREAEIIRLVLIPKKPGANRVTIEDAKVLLHDGKGTRASITTEPLLVNVSAEGAGNPPTPIKEDGLPPEAFEPLISRDPALFGGEWFVVFTTEDKESGIDHYELQEEKWWDIIPFVKKEEWKIAESPYVLEDQNRESRVRVKAIDTRGNETIVTLPSRGHRKWYMYRIGSVMIIVLIVALALSVKKKKSANLL